MQLPLKVRIFLQQASLGSIQPTMLITTLDGHGTIHAMGIIKTVNPGLQNRQCIIPRLVFLVGALHYYIAVFYMHV